MDREASPAYGALTPGGKRALSIIENAIANGTAEVSLSGFVKLGLCKVAAQGAVKQLVALGFVEVGAGERRVGVFRLATGWEAIGDAAAANQLARTARQGPSPRVSRVSKPTSPAGVQAEGPPRRVPSLPRLSFMD